MTFNDAFNYTMKYEGGYSFDKDDKGAETYKGISRHFHPDWVGWNMIDDLKKEYPLSFIPHLENDAELQSAVRQFYYYSYWLALNCEQLPKIIAKELFDTAVNMGKTSAVKILQKSLNLLNRNGYLFDDLEVDGDIGPKTIAAVYKVNPHRLLKVMNGFQFMRYAQIMKDHPVYEKFVGWFNRI